jgi:hypothetical protein
MHEVGAPSRSPDERKCPNAHTRTIDGHHRSPNEIGFAKRGDSLEEGSELGTAHSLEPDADNRGGCRVREGEEGVKVGVEGDDRPIFGPSSLEDLAVGRGGHSEVSDVHGVEPRSPQLSHGRAWPSPDTAPD